MEGRLGLILGVINLFIMGIVLFSLGGEDNNEKSILVDKVAFDYINVVENEGYLTENTRQDIMRELAVFDEVNVIGTDSIVDVGQSVNMTISVKDEGSFFKREKNFSKEILLNGVAR